MNNYTIYANYLLALSNGEVSSELRNDFIKVMSTLKNEETIFSQIVSFGFRKVKSNNNSIESIIDFAKTEYNAIGLDKIFGDFLGWENYICFCYDTYKSDKTNVEIVDSFMNYINDNANINEPIRYAILNRCLSIVLSLSSDLDLELLQDLVNRNNEFAEVPYGSEPAGIIGDIAFLRIF